MIVVCVRDSKSERKKGFICIWLCLPLWTCVEARGWCEHVFSNYFSVLCFETRFLTEPRAYHFGYTGWSSNPRDLTCLHLSVLGLYAYIPHTWLFCRCWGSKIRSWCSCCRHPIDPFPQPRSIDYGTTQASEEGQGNRIIRASGCFSAVTVEICWMIPSVRAW